MVKWLCCVRPALAQMGADPAKLRPLGREAVAKVYNVSEDEVDLSVHYLQAAWNSLFREEDLPEVRKTVEEKRAERAVKPQAEKFEFSMQDRKSTRLNSSHLGISYAVF